MMLWRTTTDSLLAPKLDGRHVWGWVDFRLLIQHNSNSLGRQGIGASCTPNMRTWFCRVFLYQERFPSEFLCRTSSASLDTNCVGCCYSDRPIVRERKIRHNTREGDGLGSSYQSLKNHVKNHGDSVRRRRCMCVCVSRDKRERGRTSDE